METVQVGGWEKGAEGPWWLWVREKDEPLDVNEDIISATLRVRESWTFSIWIVIEVIGVRLSRRGLKFKLGGKESAAQLY